MTVIMTNKSTLKQFPYKTFAKPASYPASVSYFSAFLPRNIHTLTCNNAIVLPRMSIHTNEKRKMLFYSRSFLIITEVCYSLCFWLLLLLLFLLNTPLIYTETIPIRLFLFQWENYISSFFSKIPSFCSSNLNLMLFLYYKLN